MTPLSPFKYKTGATVPDNPLVVYVKWVGVKIPLSQVQSKNCIIS